MPDMLLVCDPVFLSTVSITSLWLPTMLPACDPEPWFLLAAASCWPALLLALELAGLAAVFVGALCASAKVDRDNRIRLDFNMVFMWPA